MGNIAILCAATPYLIIIIQWQYKPVETILNIPNLSDSHETSQEVTVVNVIKLT